MILQDYPTWQCFLEMTVAKNNQLKTNDDDIGREEGFQFKTLEGPVCERLNGCIDACDCVSEQYF